MPESARILIVEDEQHIGFGLRYNLQAEGYRVELVVDGAAALEMFQASLFDLVILDLMLPGMSGYEVCKRIRETGSEVPILMLTARSLPEDRTRGFEVGTDQYMHKPFDLDELLARVKNLLQRSKRATPIGPTVADRKFNVNHRVVDPDTFEVSGGSEPFRLTALEMKLVRYFVANAGRIIPKSELLEHVWEVSGNVTTRAPDQFLRRLRKIFEDDPAEPEHFVTIRDAGYRYVP